jgi:hypothetical protein
MVSPFLNRSKTSVVLLLLLILIYGFRISKLTCIFPVPSAAARPASMITDSRSAF